jgi:E3 ubiquitin-protein ligase RHF
MFIMVRISENHPAPVDEDRAGPSDVQSLSDTLRSRLQSASMKYSPNPLELLAYLTQACESYSWAFLTLGRYKDSIAKSTSGWRERWFSRGSTISDVGSEVRREVNAGIAAVSRMMEQLETKDGTGPSATSASGSGSQ